MEYLGAGYFVTLVRPGYGAEATDDVVGLGFPPDSRGGGPESV